MYLGIIGIISSLLWRAVIIFIIVKLVSGGRKKHYSWLQRELPLWEEKNIINIIYPESARFKINPQNITFNMSGEIVYQTPNNRLENL